VLFFDEKPGEKGIKKKPLTRAARTGKRETPLPARGNLKWRRRKIGNFQSSEILGGKRCGLDLVSDSNVEYPSLGNGERGGGPLTPIGLGTIFEVVSALKTVISGDAGRKGGGRKLISPKDRDKEGTYSGSQICP